jgi:hypothetical protein
MGKMLRSGMRRFKRFYFGYLNCYGGMESCFVVLRRNVIVIWVEICFDFGLLGGAA